MTTWATIETAPKDRDILLACPVRGVVRGHWNEDLYAKRPRPYWSHDREILWGRIACRNDQPTHWMELPDMPNKKITVHEDQT